MEIKNITCAFAPAAAAPSRKTWDFPRKKAPKIHDEIMDQKLNQMIDDGYFDEFDNDSIMKLKNGSDDIVEIDEFLKDVGW